ncbi:MAG: hypothetical protein GX262_06105 [Clostridia bacterium]|nr:hypothetical protein [Clostridia bacterium]
MSMKPEMICQQGAACAWDGAHTTNSKSPTVVNTPYRWLANGFAYVFSTAFILAFLALGVAASATVITILGGFLGVFN